MLYVKSDAWLYVIRKLLTILVRHQVQSGFFQRRRQGSLFRLSPSRHPATFPAHHLGRGQASHLHILSVSARNNIFGEFDEAPIGILAAAVGIVPVLGMDEEPTRFQREFAPVQAMSTTLSKSTYM